MPQNFDLKVNEQITVSLQALAGVAPNERPGTLYPGIIPTWAHNSPLIDSITPAVDGMSAVIKPKLQAGVATISVTGQSNQFGPPFTSQFTLTLSPEPADHFGFTGVVAPKS